MKKLPRSVTVASLRLLLEKLFKVKGRAQSLFLRAPGDPLPEPLGDDNDGRPLSFFGVQARVPHAFCIFIILSLPNYYFAFRILQFSQHVLPFVTSHNSGHQIAPLNTIKKRKSDDSGDVCRWCLICLEAGESETTITFSVLLADYWLDCEGRVLLFKAAGSRL